MLPFSPSCERNKAPILQHLQSLLVDVQSVLEVGSGSGQHAVFFAASLPHVTWQPSDRPEDLPGLRSRVEQEGPNNLRPPVAVDVRDNQWPVAGVDALFTANSLHIMSEECVGHFFRGAGQVIRPGGMLIVYGPFRYGGEFTSDSNADFEQWLKRQDPLSGIRDFETVDALATEQGMQLMHDRPMPANNQLLVWGRYQ